MKDEIKHRMTWRLTGWALVERWIRLYRGEGRKWLAHGTRALVFANATPDEQTIAYRWKGVWTRTTMKPRELRLVRVSVGE